MSVQRLSSGAEDIIAIMQLTHQEEDVVRNCVSKYAKPEDFSQMFTWIFDRIVNVLKSIFGSSDWQITLGVIQSRAMQEIEAKVPQIHKRLQFRIQITTKLYSNEILDNALTAHEENVVESSIEVQLKIKPCGLADLIEKIREIARKTAPQAAV